MLSTNMWHWLQVAAEKMDAARAGQKSITGTAADLRKLGMQEARQRLLEMSAQFNLGLTDEVIASTNASLNCCLRPALHRRIPSVLTLQIPTIADLVNRIPSMHKVDENPTLIFRIKFINKISTIF